MICPELGFNHDSLQKIAPYLTPLAPLCPDEFMTLLEPQSPSSVICIAMDSCFHQWRRGRAEILGEAALFFKLRLCSSSTTHIRWSSDLPKKWDQELAYIIYPDSEYTILAAQLATQCYGATGQWPNFINLELLVGKIGHATPAFSLAYAHYLSPKTSLTIIPQASANYFLLTKVQSS